MFGGDILNVFGDFPTLLSPRHADAYSPLWDAQLGPSQPPGFPVPTKVTGQPPQATVVRQGGWAARHLNHPVGPQLRAHRPFADTGWA